MSYDLSLSLIKMIVYILQLKNLTNIQTAVMGAEEIKKDMDISSWPLDLIYEQWVALPVSGARPSARYKVFCF